MTLHRQRVKLNSPYGRLTHHFRTIKNGERGTLLRQEQMGGCIVEFDSMAGEVKVPSHWLEWVSEFEPQES